MSGARYERASSEINATVKNILDFISIISEQSMSENQTRKRRSTSQELRFASSHEDGSSQFEEKESSKGRIDESTPIEDNEFERKAIWCFRYYIFFLMVASTIAAGVITWHLLNQGEEDDYHQEVRAVDSHLPFF